MHFKLFFWNETVPCGLHGSVRMCKAEVFECICVFVCLRVCSPKAICKAPALNVVT